MLTTASCRAWVATKSVRLKRQPKRFWPPKDRHVTRIRGISPDWRCPAGSQFLMIPGTWSVLWTAMSVTSAFTGTARCAIRMATCRWLVITIRPPDMIINGVEINCETCLYIDRTAGGHRHHCHSCRVVAAGAVQGKSQGAAHDLP